MHKKTAEPSAPAVAEQDEAMRLVSLLVMMAEQVAEEFARQRIEASAADKASFAQSYDDLMVVSRLVTPAPDDGAGTKPLPPRHLPD